VPQTDTQAAFDFLEHAGWIPLGADAADGKYKWTTLLRGLQGAVPTQEAVQIEKAHQAAGGLSGLAR
jgi:hypothetical protein